MVIDDDSTIRTALQTALGRQYEVVSLPNGDEIIQEIESYKPKLLLLDINMPGSDGFEICREIRAEAKSRNLPILLMTVRKDNRSFLRSLEAGGDSYITKPFETPALKERIEYLLKSYRASSDRGPACGGGQNDE
ncbi:PleD family two-component system response regulator [Elusimicrobiota bacterium]